jgi:hypothetical protein
MSQAKALKLIRENRPVNLLAATCLGLKCVHVGFGVFRSAYHIKDTNLVIKFPQEPDKTYAKFHSAAEVRKIKHFIQYKSLRPHMPKIYYYDPKSGVIVMKRYYKMRKTEGPLVNHWNDGEYDWRLLLIGKLIKDLTGKQFEDGFGSNLAVDEKNVLKIIDLGY